AWAMREAARPCRVLRSSPTNSIRGVPMDRIFKKAVLVGASMFLGMSIALAGAQDPVEKTKDAPTGRPGSKKPVDPIASALLKAHNRVRKEEEKPALALSEKLCQAATAHAKDMAEHHTGGHVGSDKSTVAERIKRTGYPYIVVGENVA